LYASAANLAAKHIWSSQLFSCAPLNLTALPYVDAKVPLQFKFWFTEILVSESRALKSENLFTFQAVTMVVKCFKQTREREHLLSSLTD
jgi:hypothetical protein